MTDQHNPNLDAEADAQRSALAFCRLILLADGKGAAELWSNSTQTEQTRLAVALANLCNSHATVILAATSGVQPKDIPRDLLAYHYAVKLQAMATGTAQEDATPEGTAQ